MTQAVQSAPPGAGADEFRLDGYVALVTGAGRGIGAGIARAYARAGADLVLVARTAADLDDVAAAVRASGRTALAIPADLTDVSQAGKIVERAVAERGRLDILVNNAGGAMPASYLDTTPEMLDAAFHFNVAAPFELTKRATPYLLDSGRGSVVNITSRMDRLVARGMVTYGTVKAAVTQLTRLLAAELAPGVRVNGIAPGVVETEALGQVLTDELRARIVSATPLHRLATVADVASTARWLASPAASYITGKIIELDGGAEAPVFPDETPDLRPADMSRTNS
jgi:7-alpha-hydroxysteroid dehydrogenase